MLQRYLAGQLSRPTGIIGKFILGPLWNRRNARLNDVTLACLELGAEDRVLELGFGGGYLLEKIISQAKRGFVAGVDVSPVMVKNCRARWRKAIAAGQVDVQVGRAEALPYPDGHFSKASSVNSIFYWSDVRQGLAEIYRVLQPGGKAVLTFTCRKDLEKKRFAQYGVKVYNEQELESMLANVGFREIKTTRERDRHREFICMTQVKG